MVALAIVLRAPASTASAATSRTRSRADWNLATRRSRNAPATASSVFPAAMPSTAGSGTPVHEFARKAPRATAGHIRYPPSRSAASAMPVGGHTAVMLLFS